LPRRGVSQGIVGHQFWVRAGWTNKKPAALGLRAVWGSAQGIGTTHSEQKA
jgi:hypothetical protein